MYSAPARVSPLYPLRFQVQAHLASLRAAQAERPSRSPYTTLPSSLFAGPDAGLTSP